MTEKRFNRVHEMRYGQIGITDELHDSGDKGFPKNLTTEETVDLLNEQHETIQSLISDSEKYRKLSIQFDNRNKELVSENALLEKENEQLKFENKNFKRINNICEEQISELRRLVHIATHNGFIRDDKKSEWKKELMGRE